MPYIPAAGELKTKPTQHSVKELQALGIAPDILLVRADREIPEAERRKLSLFCNVRPSAVIQALDVANIRSEEHTSELQSLMRISYAVFCLTKKNHRSTLHR